MRQALAAGHQVTVVSLRHPKDPFVDRAREQAVTDQGASLEVVPVEGLSPRENGNRQSGLRVGPLSSDPGAVFPTARLRPRMKEVLERHAPEALFIYHWDTLASVHGLHLAPKVAAVDDPWHLPQLRAWQQLMPRPSPAYVKLSAEVLRSAYVYPRAMVRLLDDCEVSGCFQAHEAEWLRRRGARECQYWPSPIADECGPDWQQRQRNLAKPGKPKILLGPSNVEATCTSGGIRLFAREILPCLERELGPEGFEVHIVGEGQPCRELARLLPRPSVVVRGRVEPADEEFLTCSLQLVPTPFVLGMRKRIPVAFSFGCCVVAHTCDQANIPELKHGQNCLLSSTGSGLAEQVVRIIRDPELRERLGANGRQTYDEVFHPSKAAAPIVEKLEEVALRGSE